MDYTVITTFANLENDKDYPGRDNREKLDEYYDNKAKEFYDKISKMNLRQYTLGQPFLHLGGLAYIYHGKALYHGEEYDAYAELVDEVHDLPAYSYIYSYIGTDYNLSDIYDEVVEAFSETVPFYGNFCGKV